MRTTLHGGRSTKKNQAYSDKHNDRNFDVEHASNVTSEDSLKENAYWDCERKEMYRKADQKKSFSEVEKDYYLLNFADAYDKQMKIYIGKRQWKYVKDFDDWYRDAKKAPAETVYQIGKVGETVDQKTFFKVSQRFYELKDDYYKEHGIQADVLNRAWHFDESVPHTHERETFWYTDDEGVKRIGQEKSLEQSGVELPDPSKKPGRYNNRKMTLTKTMRGLWLDACKEFGLEIETEPAQPGKKTMTKGEWLYKHCKELEKKEAALKAQKADLSLDKANLDKKVKEADKKLTDASQELTDAKEEASRIKENAKAEIDEYKQTLKKSSDEELEEYKAQLKADSDKELELFKAKLKEEHTANVIKEAQRLAHLMDDTAEMERNQSIHPHRRLPGE